MITTIKSNYSKIRSLTYFSPSLFANSTGLLKQLVDHQDTANVTNMVKRFNATIFGIIWAKFPIYNYKTYHTVGGYILLKGECLSSAHRTVRNLRENNI